MLTCFEIACPMNFPGPGNQKRPQLHDIVTFQRHYIEVLNQHGVALMIDGVWAGWIQNHWIPTMENLLNQEITMSGHTVSSLIEEFRWNNGRGICNRGSLELIVNL